MEKCEWERHFSASPLSSKSEVVRNTTTTVIINCDVGGKAYAYTHSIRVLANWSELLSGNGGGGKKRHGNKKHQLLIRCIYYYLLATFPSSSLCRQCRVAGAYAYVHRACLQHPFPFSFSSIPHCNSHLSFSRYIFYMRRRRDC